MNIAGIANIRLGKNQKATLKMVADGEVEVWKSSMK